MMAGALQAMQEAGVDPSKYWLGSSNGKEKSWAWVQKGITTMDVNETPTLEADIAHQQIKAHFAGKPYKKAVFVYVTPFNKSDINVDKLIPFNHDDYMKKRDAGAFIYDIIIRSSASSLVIIPDGAGGGCFGSLLCARNGETSRRYEYSIKHIR